MKVKNISLFLWSAAVMAISFVVGVNYTLAQSGLSMQPLPNQSNPKVINEAVMVANAIPVNNQVVDHPLRAVVRWAENERPKVALINDYTAVMTKQECVGGVVQAAQMMEVKVRHKPFSVYVKFIYPKAMVGQEAIFVAGKYNNKVVGHGVGVQRAFGTMKLDPAGMIAMRGNKYPITEMGILNLIDKLLEVGKRDIKFGECVVNYYEGVKVDGRVCTMIEVTHPTPRINFIFNIARIYVDKELNIPIRYESYDWPKKEGSPVTLIEAYTYQKLKLNVGLTDLDFDPQNPAYNYPNE
ncbi:MAG: DUF1571 domain-containing protein [Planctomycetaceae bacterium]|jgi:hypothetical protein|nr:DUF1571 domain-containing protein [Planctomycetaceae bacterium]